MYKEWHKEYHGLETMEAEDIGFVTYNIQGSIGTVYDLFILKEKRNDGWAEALLTDLKNTMKESGVTKVYFEIQKGNNNKQFVLRLARSLSKDDTVYTEETGNVLWVDL